MSPQIADLLEKNEIRPPNVTSNPETAQRYMLFIGEIPPLEFVRWESNVLGQYHVVSGPLEVNFDYYADWHGAPMVVELSMKRALEMHIGPGERFE